MPTVLKIINVGRQVLGDDVTDDEDMTQRWIFEMRRAKCLINNFDLGIWPGHAITLKFTWWGQLVRHPDITPRRLIAGFGLQQQCLHLYLQPGKPFFRQRGRPIMHESGIQRAVHQAGYGSEWWLSVAQYKEVWSKLIPGFIDFLEAKRGVLHQDKLGDVTAPGVLLELAEHAGNNEFPDLETAPHDLANACPRFGDWQSSCIKFAAGDHAAGLITHQLPIPCMTTSRSSLF